MHIIRAHFQRFSDVNLIDLIGAIGVYVIWDAQAKARPTYIGEGNILKRFADHVARHNRRFAHPWNGYVAILADSTYKVHKSESTIIERLLLDVAKDTDRKPKINAHPGHLNKVLSLSDKQMLKIAVSGYDPLLPPAEARPLSEQKEIKIWRVGNSDEYEFDHSWRLRRLRKPIN